MKRKLVYLVLIFSLFQIYAQNKITLSSGQRDLLPFTEVLGSNYNLSEFEEAVFFTGNDPDLIFSGTYCIFKDYSYVKSQNSKIKNKFLSKIIYIYPNKKDYSDVLMINENDSYTPEPDIKQEQEREYIEFDNSGRIFINVSKKSEGLVGILMYSPKSEKKSFFWLPKEYKKVEDFAISPDGKYIVVSGNNGNSMRSSQAFLFFTDEEFLEPRPLLYLDASKLSSIIYNPQNQSFYMIASFFDPELENDESGKICVLPYQNDTYSTNYIKYFSQRDIENGENLNFWDNLFVIDQLDSKIYAASNPKITYPEDGKLYELIDNSKSLKLKLVEETSHILFHNADGTEWDMISTPLGLFFKDKNSRTYLLKNHELTETTINSLNKMLEEYNLKIFNRLKASDQTSRYKSAIETSEQTINELKSKSKIYIFLLIIFIIITIALALTLCFVGTYRRILIGRSMQKKILGLQEAERAKLSRDIHDSVVQDIRAIRLQTGLIDVGENLKAQQQKERVIDDISQTIVKMRNICYNLTPAELLTHQEGDSAKIELISIIDSLCQQFYVKTKIPCSLQIDTNLIYPEYDKETSLHLVRVFQELLNNIEKHSYATNVNVLVRNKQEDNQNYLVIFVIDDGIGCNIQQCLNSRKKNHFGLTNIQERIKLIDGQIEFYSSQNEGMKIKITVKM